MTDAVDQVCADTEVKKRPRVRVSKALVIRVTIFITFYYFFLAYPVLRLGTAAFPEWRPGTGALLVIFVLPALGRIVHDRWPSYVSRWILRAVMTWVGICFIAFSVLLVAEVLRWLWAVTLPGSYSLQGWAIGVGVLIGGLCGYALINAQRLRVKELTVPIARSGAELTFDGNGLARVCQISDVHVGSRDPHFLRRVVNRVNACNADVVLITGDLIDIRNIQESELQALSEFKAPAYFCIGNHERYIDVDAIVARLRNLGVGVLRNSLAMCGSWQIIGIDDAESRSQVGDVLPGIVRDRQKPTILLYHRPDGLEAAEAGGIDLMLCGHTHNGQILPFNWLVKRVFPRIQGLYRSGRTALYVSPGTGTWGPVMRVGSRNEITVLTLVVNET
ncbi:MAG: metallophosphoesterase [Pseudomonadota bacterium]